MIQPLPILRTSLKLYNIGYIICFEIKKFFSADKITSESSLYKFKGNQNFESMTFS